ncbi:MAG TPA: SRPBCC family protein [Acidimicrobiales bacterium]|nr:SRPBCC family protein [Acidimicrobiales bacterium]
METPPSYSSSVVIERPPEALYDMVADVTRMGEWSRECRSCTWDDDAGPTVGDWFSGTNVDADHEWTTHCEIVAADRGREFAFVVEGYAARWGYTFEAVDGGTRVTESWRFSPAARARFHEIFGDQAEERIAFRAENAKEEIAATLASLKHAAESG